jgi:hypothetical protein
MTRTYFHNIANVTLDEPNAKGMHQKRVYNAMVQMPHVVAGSDALELVAIGEMAEDCGNTRASLSQNRKLGDPSL